MPYFFHIVGIATMVTIPVLFSFLEVILLFTQQQAVLPITVGEVPSLSINTRAVDSSSSSSSWETPASTASTKRYNNNLNSQEQREVKDSSRLLKKLNNTDNKEREELLLSTISRRRIIHPFSILLEPTPSKIGANAIHTFLSTRIKSVLESFIEQKLKYHSFNPDTTRLDNIFLGSIDSVFLEDKHATIVSLNSTWASFRANTKIDIPSTDNVNKWVAQAINTDLAAALNSTLFYQLKKSTYSESQSNSENAMNITSVVTMIGLSIAGIASGILCAFLVDKCLIRKITKGKKGAELKEASTARDEDDDMLSVIPCAQSVQSV